MADTVKYNGHANYSTWACSLWLDNDQGTYEYWHDRAREALLENRADVSRTVSDVEDELRALHEAEMEQALEQIPTGWMHDVFRSGFRDIDFREIARGFVEDVMGEYRKEQLDLISQGLDPDDWDTPTEDDE